MTKKDSRTPAQRAVDAWGGEVELASDLRIDTSTVRQWLRRGVGRIPAAHHRPMLAIAKKRDLPFGVEDLV